MGFNRGVVDQRDDSRKRALALVLLGDSNVQGRQSRDLDISVEIPYLELLVSQQGLRSGFTVVVFGVVALVWAFVQDLVYLVGELTRHTFELLQTFGRQAVALKDIRARVDVLSA